MVYKKKKKVELEEVKDKKQLPPNVEHKILTKEEMIKRKWEATQIAKQLNLKEEK